MYPWAQRAERFTDKPFDPVALDAFADFFAGGDAQARTGSRCVLQAREDVYHKIAIQVFPTFLIGTLEFPPFFEPVWMQYFCCSRCVRVRFRFQCYPFLVLSSPLAMSPFSMQGHQALQIR